MSILHDIDHAFDALFHKIISSESFSEDELRKMLQEARHEMIQLVIQQAQASTTSNTASRSVAPRLHPHHQHAIQCLTEIEIGFLSGNLRMMPASGQGKPS